LRIGVVIGRFQPYHRGHHHVSLQAWHNCDMLVMVMCSPNRARTMRDPLTPGERKMLVAQTHNNDFLINTRIAHDWDKGSDAEWYNEVKSGVENFGGPGDEFVLFAHKKDAAVSRYVSWFTSRWKVIEVDSFPLNATDIRNHYYHGAPMPDGSFVTEAHAKAVNDLFGSPELRPVLAMADMPSKYARKHGKGPFVTVDSKVFCGDSILLVRRKNPPFEGLWALPGGFLNPGENTLQGALRELREETGLKVDLSPYVEGHRVYSEPDRDPRASVVSVVHTFYVPPELSDSVTDVSGQDDASEAAWHRASVVRRDMRTQMAFDHWDIVMDTLRT
jgi:bifunctional NMN adenylyltransferase/nudix hydrolase